MHNIDIKKAYDFSGQIIAITGGNGVLGRAMVAGLLRCGAAVAVIDRNPDLPAEIAELGKSGGGQVFSVAADVLDRSQLAAAAQTVIDRCGRIDALINAAGGNHPQATTSTENPFFDLPVEALRFTQDLNWLGTVLACQVFGRHLAEQKQGVIVNISSMNAFRPLTRIPAYSAAKAAVSNFTQWLAVHMAQEYSPQIRVNALAPGFFLTEQNRFLLTDQASGELTERGKTILSHTPMARFGDPADLVGTLLWLLSPASAFVTGIVVPVDGGFSAYSGV